MYHPYSFLFFSLFLSGCAVIDNYRSVEVSTDGPDQTGQYRAEKQALFEQPFIDPLTDYLIEHQGDSQREIVLGDIRQERDRRCREVAAQYAKEPATEQALERFNTGYAYSCPQQVADFDARVNRQTDQAEAEPKPAAAAKPEPAPKPEPEPDGPKISDQALSDCYLLTTIRNFSAAKAACLEPAQNGDVRSQANMAIVAHAFEDYATALEWARKAAPGSGEAAFLLGQMYAAGRGVSQNMDKAVYWYEQAARQGHKEGQAILDRDREGSPAGNF